MRLLDRWRTRRSAKNYARKLGPHLQRAYGAAAHYSPGQIRTSVTKLGLNPKFVALAYAAFLTEDEYTAIASTLPVELAYGQARELFERYRSAARYPGSHNSPENTPIVGI